MSGNALSALRILERDNKVTTYSYHYANGKGYQCMMSDGVIIGYIVDGGYSSDSDLPALQSLLNGKSEGCAITQADYLRAKR